MTSTSTITILRASEPLTKTISKGGADAPPVTTPFNQNIAWYSVEERPVSNIDELFAVLTDVIQDNRAGVVRDAPTADTRAAIEEGRRLQVPGRTGDVVRSNGQIRRLKHDPENGTHGTLEAKPQHLMAFDVDDVASDHLHIRDRPGEAARYVIEHFLPEAFHNATCIVHWTSSAGVRDFTTTKMRLWFWLSESTSSADLKRLCLSLGLQVDAAIFNPTQLHFTATPIFVGMADPMPNRLLLIRGESDVVVLPEVEAIAPQSHGSTKAPLGADRSWSAGLDFEACLATIGDGPGLNGFDAPTFAAARAWVRQTHPSMWESQRPHVRAMMIAAVEAAPKNKGRNVADYLSGRKIDQKIDSAIAYAQKARAEAADDFADDVAEDDLPVAQERVAEAIHKAISSAVAWHTARREAEERAITAAEGGAWVDRRELGASAKGKIYREQVKHRKAGTFSTDNLHREEIPPPPQAAVLAQVGIGKSEALLNALARHADALAAMKVSVYLPTNELSQEMLERALVKLPEKLNPRLHRGRTDTKLGPPLCDPMMHEAANLVREVGGSVETDLCGTCKFNENCGWLKQRRDKAPGVVFKPITYATQPGAEDDDIAVFDEAFMDNLVSERSLRLSSLGSISNVVVPPKVPKKADKKEAEHFGLPPEEEARLATTHLIRARKMLWEATAQGTKIPTLSELIEAGIDAGTAEAAKALEYRRLDARPDLKGMNLEQIRAAVAAFKSKHGDARAWAHLWGCIEVELGVGWKSVLLSEEEKRTWDWSWNDDGPTKLVRTREQLNGLRLGTDKEGHPAIFAGRRKRLKCEQRPMLVLDATGSEKLLRLAVPHLGEAVRVRAKAPYAKVVQVVDQQFSKWVMLPDAKDDDDKSATKARKRKRIAETAEAFAQGKSAGLLTHEAVEALIAPLLPRNFVTGHFNALRGLNTWERVAVLAVVGRVMPRADELERIAGALAHDQPEAVMKGAQIGKVDAWHRMREGAPVKGYRRVHPDPWCEAVRRQITESELEQSIGRARAVRRGADGPVLVLVFGQTPLAGAVDHLVSFAEIEPDEVILFAARHGIELTCAEHLYGAQPDLFTSREAAKKMVARRCGTSPIDKFSIGNVPHLEPIRYQLAGPGQRNRDARVNPARVPDIATWFEAYLGQPLITIKAKMRSSEPPDHCQVQVEAAYPAAPPQRRFSCYLSRIIEAEACAACPLIFLTTNERQLQRQNRNVTRVANNPAIYARTATERKQSCHA